MKQVGPYFEGEERISKLIETTRSWAGTPYRHMGECKQGGVDCTKLLAFIFVELGLMEKVDAQYYGTDWFVGSEVEVVLVSFTTHLARWLKDGLDWHLLKYNTIEGKPTKLYPGDILLMTLNDRGTCNHTAMYMGARKMFHVIQGLAGAEMTDYSDYWADKVRFILRILE